MTIKSMLTPFIIASLLGGTSLAAAQESDRVTCPNKNTWADVTKSRCSSYVIATKNGFPSRAARQMKQLALKYFDGNVTKAFATIACTERAHPEDSKSLAQGHTTKTLLFNKMFSLVEEAEGACVYPLSSSSVSAVTTTDENMTDKTIQDNWSRWKAYDGNNTRVFSLQ